MRGHVYMGDFTPRSGSELTGIHPLIVISNDAINEAKGWMSITVIPISSSARPRPPLTVELPQGCAGLTRDSLALCHQITTIDRSKLKRLLGVLPDELLEQVEEALKATLDLS